jgi:hypothetical protein
LNGRQRSRQLAGQESNVVEIRLVCRAHGCCAGGIGDIAGAAGSSGGCKIILRPRGRARFALQNLEALRLADVTILLWLVISALFGTLPTRARTLMWRPRLYTVLARADAVCVPSFELWMLYVAHMLVERGMASCSESDLCRDH